MAKHRSNPHRDPATLGPAEIVKTLLTQLEAGRRLLATAMRFPPGEESTKRYIPYAIRTLTFAEAQMSKLNTFPSRLKLIRKEADLLQLEIDALPTEYRTHVGLARG
jgi:hypothetical protein